MMTERVRTVAESNRAEYEAQKYAHTHYAATDYNKLVLRAVLLDWKEYLSRNITDE